MSDLIFNFRVGKIHFQIHQGWRFELQLNEYHSWFRWPVIYLYNFSSTVVPQKERGRRLRTNNKIDRLLNGETIISKEPGNSMVPRIKHRQPVRIVPTTWDQVEVGDIVYCKVRGNFYTHLVTAKNDKKGCQISNNKGHVNGWTKAVYGKVIEIMG